MKSGEEMKVYVGFDVSKGYADLEMDSDTGSCLVTERIDDTAAGQRKLSELFARHHQENTQTEFVVGLEASGGLERNWVKFLRTLKTQYRLELLVLNPVAVKKYSDRNLRRNKT